jgi:hypothetical protein
MRFFSVFQSSRTFTPGQIEARRLAEYCNRGSIEKRDKEDYLVWLEEQLTRSEEQLARLEKHLAETKGSNAN